MNSASEGSKKSLVRRTLLGRIAAHASGFGRFADSFMWEQESLDTSQGRSADCRVSSSPEFCKSTVSLWFMLELINLWQIVRSVSLANPFHPVLARSAGRVLYSVSRHGCGVCSARCG